MSVARTKFRIWNQGGTDAERNGIDFRSKVREYRRGASLLGGWPTLFPLFLLSRVPRPCRVFCDRAGNLISLGQDGVATSLRRCVNLRQKALRRPYGPLDGLHLSH